MFLSFINNKIFTIMATSMILGAISAFGLQYWWAFLIIWLLWIIVAHIPNGPDHHYLDIYVPFICIVVWVIALIFDF